MVKLSTDHESNFSKITLDQFECITSSSLDYEETEIDGHRVTVAFENGQVISVYYHEKMYGSVNHKSISEDFIDYVEADPFFPQDWC
jgi:hypothetical protein